MARASDFQLMHHGAHPKYVPMDPTRSKMPLRRHTKMKGGSWRVDGVFMLSSQKDDERRPTSPSMKIEMKMKFQRL